MPFRHLLNNLSCSYYCLHMGAWKASPFESDHTVQPVCAPSLVPDTEPEPWAASPRSTSYEGLSAQKPSPPHLQGPRSWEQDIAAKQEHRLETSNTPREVTEPWPRSQGRLPPGSQMPAQKAGLTMQACLSLLSSQITQIEGLGNSPAKPTGPPCYTCSLHVCVIFCNSCSISTFYLTS